MKTQLVFASLLLSFSLSSAAHATEAALTTTSTDGAFGAGVPAPGEARLALGLRWSGALPMAELRWLHGLARPIALDLALATSGVTQEARVGARVRIYDDATRAIALRASVFESHALDREPRLVLAAGPGLLAGSRFGAWTVGAQVDVALTLLDARAFYVERATFGVRSAATASRELFGARVALEVGVWVVTSELSSTTLPFSSLALTW